MPYVFSAYTRTKSWPPPVTMYVLKELTRRYCSTSCIGLYVRSFPSRVAGRVEPFGDFELELIDGHAGQRRREDLLQILHGQSGDRLAIARHHGLERLDLGQSRLFLDQHGHPIEAVDHLRVD